MLKSVLSKQRSPSRTCNKCSWNFLLLHLHVRWSSQSPPRSVNEAHTNMYSNLFHFFGIILSSSFSNNINMLHFSFIICLICWFSASAHLIHSNYSMILWWILNYSYPHTGTWGKPKQSDGMKVTLRISLPFEEWGLFIENKRKHSLCWFWGVSWMGMMGRGWPYVWVVLKVKAKAKKKDTTRVETWRCILCLAGCSVRLSVFS